MKLERIFSARASVLALTLALAACGGGGSGGAGVSSTPTPTPAATNEDLLAPLVSESFANDATGASGTFPKSGALPTITAAPETATIRYDSSNASYSITAGSRSITFLPTQIDSSLSSATIDTYVKHSGSTTDTLVLTKPGTSGRFTYQYVGGAYWQHVVDGSTDINGSIDAFAYGVSTPVAAAPVSGRAEYALDVVGAETYAGAITGVTGQATLQFDLANGQIRLDGTLGPQGSGQPFNGTSTLSNSSDGFIGGFSLNYSGTGLQGGYSGRFYGPDAQEVGLAFVVRDGTGSQVALGSMIGRGGPLSYETFDPSKAVADQAGLTASYNSTAKTFSDTSAHNLPLEARFDGATGTYMLINSERSFTGAQDTPSTFVNDTDLITAYGVPDYNYLKPLRWTQTSKALAGSGENDRYTVSDFIAGSFTPDANVPRTGLLGYKVVFEGTAAGSGFDGLAWIQGGGSLYADFASGTLTASGSVAYTHGIEPTPLFQAFSATAQLASTTNSFSGRMDLTGSASFTGDWSGHFYGSDASEIGSAVSLTDFNGNVISGILFGAQTPDLTLDYTGLLDLTAPTTFQVISGAAVPAITVSYDPGTATYSLITDPTSTTADMTFGPAQKDMTLSDATNSVYKFDQPTNTLPNKITATVLNSGASNPTIALSYVSFVNLFVYDGFTHQISGNASSDRDEATVFGLVTPLVQLPRSGAATYTGIVAGGGTTYSSSAGTQAYSLSGTSTFNFDFSSNLVTGALTLVGHEMNTNATRAFGQYDFIGDQEIGVNRSAIFSARFNSINGELAGAFFGPQGAEVGAAFKIDTPQIAFSGAAVAKKVQ